MSILSNSPAASHVGLQYSPLSNVTGEDRKRIEGWVASRLESFIGEMRSESVRQSLFQDRVHDIPINVTRNDKSALRDHVQVDRGLDALLEAVRNDPRMDFLIREKGLRIDRRPGGYPSPRGAEPGWIEAVFRLSLPSA